MTAIAEKEPTGKPAPARRETVRDRVMERMRFALLTGRIVPGRAETLRGLAEEFRVSPMPVREAVHRLAAEGALEIRPNGGLHVPAMGEARLREIIRVRTLLEPELARMALPNLTGEDAATLRVLDTTLDRTIADGNVEDYMRFNHAFHFHLYQAAESEVMLPLVESVWLQFGPFMRMVGGRVGTARFVDRHKQALEAIATRDSEALAHAIRDDVGDGMEMLGASLFGWPSSDTGTNGAIVAEAN